MWHRQRVPSTRTYKPCLLGNNIGNPLPQLLFLDFPLASLRTSEIFEGAKDSRRGRGRIKVTTPKRSRPLRLILRENRRLHRHSYANGTVRARCRAYSAHKNVRLSSRTVPRQENILFMLVAMKNVIKFATRPIRRVEE